MKDEPDGYQRLIEAIKDPPWERYARRQAGGHAMTTPAQEPSREQRRFTIWADYKREHGVPDIDEGTLGYIVELEARVARLEAALQGCKALLAEDWEGTSWWPLLGDIAALRGLPAEQVEALQAFDALNGESA